MASWVHSQRKNYECLKSGKTSPLSAERIDKLEKIGFGGKTLSLIKSMYHNDHIRFLINGSYTEPLWLTQGVKQGK